MKTMKKLAGIALTLVLALALAVPAFAADLTITNANMDETYTAYKILDATINEAKTSYSYTAAEGWDGFLSTVEAKDVLTANTNTTPTTYTAVAGVQDNGDEMKAFATAALAYAKNNDIASVGTASKDEVAKTVAITGLDEGYYVIDSTMGTVCMVQTADSSLTINEKNETVPVPTKNQNTDDVTKGVGDVITYTVEVEVKAGAENYVLHDTMSTGLTYNNDISAKVKSSEATVNLTPVVPLPAGETIAVSIDNVGDYVGECIVFTYTATINAQAVTVDKVTNDASVSYGSGSSTTESHVEYELYEITINKWALAAGDAPIAERRSALTGAKFALYQVETEGTPISLVKDGGFYRPATSEDTVADIVTEIDMTEDATMVIKGLKAGDYYLEETQAPEGYNALAARQLVKITVDGVSVDATADVDNQSGAVLPSTGGIGTTIFYVGGGILVAAAAILLITKKRMSAAN